MIAEPRAPFDGFTLRRIDSFELLDEPEERTARLIPPFRVAHALATPMMWVVAAAGQANSGLAWHLGLGDLADGMGSVSEDDDMRIPSGATATRITTQECTSLLSECDAWVTLEAVVMPHDESIESEELRDAILAQLAQRRFVCILRARPAGGAEIESELAALDRVARVGQVAGRADYASARASTDLATERYRDLAVARVLGGWNVEVAVAAPSADVTVVAELLAAALDIPGLAFRPQGRDVVTAAEDWMKPRPSVLASTKHLATLIRSPSRELPGVALRQQMPFDMNAESDSANGEPGRTVELGAALDAAMRPSARFAIASSTLNRHALVCGATGSGKSQSVQLLLEQLTSIGVPWLVIEPAKSEYRSMHHRLRAAGSDAHVHVIRLGDPDSPPLGLNPLEPEAGFPLQTHVDMVTALFVASFDAVEPFPQILASALRRCYTDLGWDLATGEYKRNEMGRPERRGEQYPRYPTLADLQTAARDVVHGIGYGKEVRDNVLGFVDVRLGSLRHGTPGRFFQGGHPLDLATLHKSNVVIEIEDVGNDLDKAFVIGTVILRLYQYLRVKGPTNEAGLTHVTVVEEAHRLLRRSEPGTKQNQAVELFGALLSEVRAFGEGIIIAEQIPTKILPDVLKNTAVQIVHRLPSVEDRAILAGTTNMNDAQAAFVVSLRPGQAAAFREGMDSPILLKVDHPGTLPEVAAAVPNLGTLRSRRPSLACDAKCDGAPCNARELEIGTRLARAIPELPFWIELVFLAFVSGNEIPRPGRVWLGSLRERLAVEAIPGCALTGLVEQAIDARWAQIGDFYDPLLLTQAVAEATSSIVLDETNVHTTVEFATGRFLLEPVVAALRAMGGTKAAHPLTAEWRQSGVDIKDQPAPSQHVQLILSRQWKYGGHTRMVSGLAPSGEFGPASRVELLAAALAHAAVGAAAVKEACERTTIDHAIWTPRLTDWLGLTTG